MEFIDRDEVPVAHLPGRDIQRVVGKAASLESRKMTVGIARYGLGREVMQPHQHAEETVFVIDAHHARVRYGPTSDDLPCRIDLKPGLTLHIPEWEWHIFEWDDDGYAYCLVIYGQVDNIRPEDRAVTESDSEASPR